MADAVPGAICEHCSGTGRMDEDSVLLATVACPLPCPACDGLGRSLTESEMIEIEERWLHWAGF